MEENKICSQCGVEKILNTENFPLWKYPNGKEFYAAMCRECKREKARSFAADHREERKEYLKEFEKNNPEYKKQWKKDNREKINKQEKEKHNNNVSYKLRKNCSRAIHRMLTKNNSSKAGYSILEFLPYTPEELKSHIESLFDENMNWENYGIYWEIDHIIPQSDLPYASMEEENFKVCWALKNLRPYPATLNRSDGATRIRHKPINNNTSE